MSKKHIDTKIVILTLLSVVCFIWGTLSVIASTSNKEVNENATDITFATKQDRFNIGEPVHFNNSAMTVNSVKFHTDEQGKTLVVVNVTIKNYSGKTLAYTPRSFQLLAEETGTDLTSEDTTINNQLHDGVLEDGESISGNIVGQSNKLKNLKLVYDVDAFQHDTKFTVDLN